VRTAPRPADPFLDDPHEPRITPNPFTPPGLDKDLDPFEQPFTPKEPKDPDSCQCEKEPKKKKKKKAEDRTVCYRGTYRQLKKGISYKRLEEVPCDAKTERKAKTPRKKAKQPKTIGDLVDLIF